MARSPSALSYARFALVAMLGAAGCAETVVSLDDGARPYTEVEYDEVYERWTRADDEFSWTRMTDVLRVSATFESWDFRWAYVVRYCHDHSMDVAERDAMLRATLADAEQTHRFFISMQGERIRETDLTGRLAAWRVLMVDADGRQTTPVEIQPIRRPTAAHFVYFPHLTVQRTAFRVAFPAFREDGSPTIPETSREVRLRFAGARGRVDLIWALRRDGQEAGAQGEGAQGATFEVQPAPLDERGAEPSASAP